MIRFFAIVFIAGLSLVAIVEGGECKLDEEKLEKTIKSFKRKCLKKGFESTLANCNSKGDPEQLSEDDIKKCEKYAKKLTACDYACEALVDGGWSDFGEWSTCSKECGRGKQTRKRECNNPAHAPSKGGAECEGDKKEKRSCNTHSCSAAVDGGWGAFSEWTECSAECGGGTQTRSKECNNPAPAQGGAECEGAAMETRDCNTQACPVDGGWGAFSEWTECSAECGGGTQTRSKECNNPAPAHGGAECEGAAMETRDCNTQACPVDGGWGAFSEWTECSAECGGGTQTRSKECNNPAPAHGGAECEGASMETRDCNTQACPVDGGWGAFSEWTECSAECGGGTQNRSKDCNNPAPAHGGAECEGAAMETFSLTNFYHASFLTVSYLYL